MKKHPALIFIASFLLISNLPAAEPQKWQSDWTEFGKELAAIMAKPGATAYDIDPVFNLKGVEWQGVVAGITLPNTTNQPAKIEMRMTAVALALGGTEKVELSGVNLRPKGEEEWKSWREATVGTRVVFRTTLKNPGLGGMGAIGVMRGMGQFAGKVFVVVFSDGGTMLRVIPPESKKQE